MQSEQPIKEQPRVGRSVCASLLLGLWLAISAVASSPQLHELLHPDSQALNHHCLFAQWSKGALLDGFSSFVVLGTPSLVEDLPPITQAYFLSTSDHRLSPSRAPPTVVSSSQVVG